MPSRGIRRPGSVLAAKVNYRQEEATFEKTDIPEKALEAKKHVLASKHQDVLGLTKPDWDGTTGPSTIGVPQRPLVRQISEVSIHLLSSGCLSNPVSIVWSAIQLSCRSTTESRRSDLEEIDQISGAAHRDIIARGAVARNYSKGVLTGRRMSAVDIDYACCVSLCSVFLPCTCQ